MHAGEHRIVPTGLDGSIGLSQTTQRRSGRSDSRSWRFRSWCQAALHLALQNRPAGPLGGFTRSAPHHSQGSIGVGTVGPPVGNLRLRLLLPARVAACRCLGPATGEVGTAPRTEPRSARWPTPRVPLAAGAVAELPQDRRILRQWLTAGGAATRLIPLGRRWIPVAHVITTPQWN